MAGSMGIVTSGEIPGIMDVIREIQSGSDRVAAVVGGALVDELLRLALRKSLRHDPKVFEDVTQGNGPLATFSACINMGYLLNLYGKEVRSDLHTIRKIRNEFAHKLNATFSIENISHLCFSLNLAEQFTVDMTHERTNDEKFETEQYLELPFWVYIDERDKSLKDPRERFIAELQVIAWALHAAGIKAGTLG